MAGGNLGPTAYCTALEPAPYLSAAIITSFLNDTLVFFAIAHRLMMTSADTDVEKHRGVMSHLRIFTSAKSLPLFCRVLVRENQIYYL